MLGKCTREEVDEVLLLEVELVEDWRGEEGGRVQRCGRVSLMFESNVVVEEERSACRTASCYSRLSLAS